MAKIKPLTTPRSSRPHDPLPGERWCEAGKHFEKLESFHANKNDPEGRSRRCKTCTRAVYLARRERLIMHERLRRRGLTQAQYDEMRENGCKVCGAPTTVFEFGGRCDEHAAVILDEEVDAALDHPEVGSLEDHDA